jgi:two-component system cell cycle response regulator DivK
LTTIVKILKTRGYQTIEAVDGQEALEKAVAERPDLILMDRSLPKIDGYEVTRRLKGREEFKNIPIVALTAHAMRGDREKALEAGCEGYISKPINIRELPGLITSYLGGRKEGILGGEEE